MDVVPELVLALLLVDSLFAAGASDFVELGALEELEEVDEPEELEESFLGVDE